MKRNDVLTMFSNAFGKGADVDKVAELLADVVVKSGAAEPDKRDKPEKVKKK